MVILQDAFQTHQSLRQFQTFSQGFSEGICRIERQIPWVGEPHPNVCLPKI